MKHVNRVFVFTLSCLALLCCTSRPRSAPTVKPPPQSSSVSKSAKFDALQQCVEPSFREYLKNIDRNPAPAGSGSTRARVFLIDKSRSMVHEDKLKWSRAWMRNQLFAMKGTDRVAVIGYDSTPFHIIRMSNVVKAKESADKRIKMLFPVGKSFIVPALDDARRMLAKEKAESKEIVIISDGLLTQRNSGEKADKYILKSVERIMREDIKVRGILVGRENVDQKRFSLLMNCLDGTLQRASNSSELQKIRLK